MTRSAFRWPSLVAIATLLPLTLQAQSAGSAVRSFEGALTAVTDASADDAGREHSFEAAAGQILELRATSADFDTVLELISPDGESLVNDDYGDSTNSRIWTVATSSGSWRAVVRSFGAGDGEYRLDISIGTAGAIREMVGTLDASDSISAKGHRYTRHPIPISISVRLVVEMTAEDFDPELILLSPAGELFPSEDIGSGGRATVTVPIATAGEWVAVATHSLYSEGLGEYTIRVIETGDGGSAESRSGELTRNSPRQIHGEHYETYVFAGSATAPLILTLSSNDFDAFLAAYSPSGQWFSDDDGGGGSDARLELPAQEGNWTVIVTTFHPGVLGRYRLNSSR